MKVQLVMTNQPNLTTLVRNQYAITIDNSIYLVDLLFGQFLNCRKNTRTTDKRCYVIDIGKREVLYNTFIAHGKNSGENYATIFSNINNSKQSSLGFFQTSNTYMGSNGYSIRLDGLEKNINHYAKKRDIVIHGAKYVSQEFIDENGRLGRSWGCPALPKDRSTEIIDVIKGGSCVFIYADDPEYLSKSYYVAEKSSLKNPTH